MTSANNKNLEKLIEGLKDKNRKSQELVYQRYYGMMMSISNRYCENWDDAKEVVNSSFLKIFTKIEHYAGKGSFEGWMKKTVVNTALDHIKSKKIINVGFENINQLEEDVYIENAADLEINSEDIMMLVQSLPDATRAVFNLYVIEGYKHKEISDMLNISEGTSHWHLQNARKLLKQKLTTLL